MPRPSLRQLYPIDRSSVRQDALLVGIIVATGLVESLVAYSLSDDPELVLAGGMLILVLVGVSCLLYSLRE